jgi:putative ABC transport system permease protein
VAGRLFQSSDSEEPQQLIVLNAEAVRRAGFISPELAVGQVVKFRDHTLTLVDRTIAGIAPDIRFNSLREPVEPLMYLPLSIGSTLTAQARGSYAEAEQALHDVWPKHFPNAPFEPRPARDIYAANYADDARLAWVLALATLIAILIAACGAYVLAVDAVRRRTREIALRKLFGARRAHIGGLVSRELGSLLLIAAAIALPVSGLFIARYLANFTEHTPLAYASLGMALLVAMLVVAAATARQAWLAMRMRPAAALRGG